MKGWLCLLLVWGVLGVEVGSKCREKKSLMQIITKGKIIEAVEGIERIIEAGLLPDDIVSFTPKFQKLIPEMIEQSLTLLPLLKEIVEPVLQPYFASGEKKLYSKLTQFKSAIPSLRKQGYPIVKSGVLIPKLKITEDQFQLGLDNIEKYLKLIDFQCSYT